MVVPWVIDEMETVDLKDKRLNKRLGEVLSQLGGHPTASIPAACGGYAEMAAAYRLFDNEKVNFESVLQPHIDATRRRIADQPVAILAQDTTEIDLTRPDRKLPPVSVNVVLVREINPPAGEQPVQWLLLTDMPIDTVPIPPARKHSGLACNACTTWPSAGNSSVQKQKWKTHLCRTTRADALDY